MSWQSAPRGQSAVLAHVTFGMTTFAVQYRAPSTLGVLHPSHRLEQAGLSAQAMAQLPLLRRRFPTGQPQIDPPAWQT
jgi:hypothetical protein